MTKYILTSVHYTGAVQFEYNDSGLMLFYSVLDAEISERMLVGLLKKLPREEQDLATFQNSEFFTLKKLSEDLSFENFWNQYDKKIHAIRCQPFWDKMSDVKRLAAIKGIAPYNAYLDRSGVAKVNPENYLKKQYYKEEWSKLR